MSTLKVDGIRSNSATSDAITLASDGTCTANITNNLSNRNKIINGGMIVHQRSSSVTGITSNGYQTADRMLLNVSTGTFTNTISTDTPDEFGSSFKLDCTTADTSLSAGDNILLKQRIEGQNLQDFAKGTSAAKQFAVSFYVKTNKSGVYTVELSDIDNNRIASKTITVSDSNWNRYTLIFPADTTGAFDNDTAASLDLIIWLAAGTTFTSGTLNTSSWASKTNANRVSSSNVNFADSTSNEFYLTGVQLEVGSHATDFEHRSYGQELALCQRYFYKPDLNSYLQPAYQYGANNKMSLVEFPTTMRATPTCTKTYGNTTNSFTEYHPSTSHYKAYVSGSPTDNNVYYLTAFQASAEL
jgi:hypothetical protein|tara:strand:- start:1320 stop:2390 length:1071 start_codon:yes stop_codon:yes gene_type:complete